MCLQWPFPGTQYFPRGSAPRAPAFGGLLPRKSGEVSSPHPSVCCLSPASLVNLSLRQHTSKRSASPRFRDGIALVGAPPPARRIVRGHRILVAGSPGSRRGAAPTQALSRYRGIGASRIALRFGREAGFRTPFGRRNDCEKGGRRDDCEKGGRRNDCEGGGRDNDYTRGGRRNDCRGAGAGMTALLGGKRLDPFHRSGGPSSTASPALLTYSPTHLLTAPIPSPASAHTS